MSTDDDTADDMADNNTADELVALRAAVERLGDKHGRKPAPPDRRWPTNDPDEQLAEWTVDKDTAIRVGEDENGAPWVYLVDLDNGDMDAFTLDEFRRLVDVARSALLFAADDEARARYLRQ